MSPLAVAVVSLESQLSCSAASVGATGGAADPDAEVLLLDAGVPLLPVASAGVSGSGAVFVHCRAFFCRARRIGYSHSTSYGGTLTG